MALGLFTGPIYDRGYFRTLICSGSFLTVFGMLMTSIASSYYQVLLAQGVCVGLGFGCTYVPILAAVSMQFTTKRSIALGIIATGACVGGIVFPIMIRELVPRIGFGWAVRCVAFVHLGCALVALAITCRRPNHAYQARRFLHLSALRKPPYALFTLAMFLIFLPYYVPFTYIPSFAQTALAASDHFAGYLLAIANAGSFVGRIMPYVLGARIPPIRIFVFWALASVILLFSWIGVTTMPGFVVWCVLWGFVSGALVTAPIASMSHTVLSPSPAELGTRIGMSMFAAAAGELVGAPVAGALANGEAAYYTRAQAVLGAIMMVGTACLAWPLIAISRSDVREKRHVLDQG